MSSELDQYAIHVAFDDIFVGAEAPPTDYARTAWGIINQAKRRNLVTPPMLFSTDYAILGQDDDDVPTGLPIYDYLHSRFASEIPKPKPVRVDDEATYAAFRENRRKPYVAALEMRLAALEQAVAEHVSDGHAGGKLAALESRFTRHAEDDRRLTEAFQQHVSDGHGGQLETVIGADAHRAVVGGEQIALPMAEAKSGAIVAWQDGPELFCTVRIMTPSGIRLITVSERYGDALDKTLDYAMASDDDPEGIMGVVPFMAQVLGASALVPQICRVVPDLLRQADRETLLGVLVSPTDPKLAAAMALLQRAQRGDLRALHEAEALSRTHSDLFAEACFRLVHGQRAARGQK